MIKLMKAELKKIFRKKSFLIVTIIFVFYAILTNVLYKNLNEIAFFEEIDVEEYREINDNLVLTNNDELYEYISNLTIIETEELKDKYSSNNQIYLIDNYLSSLIEESYEYKYVNKNEEDYKNLRTQIDTYIDRIKKEDWQYFVNLDITKLNNNLNNTNDSITIKRYQEVIKLKEYRLNNGISFDENNYLNNALIDLEINMYEYYNLSNKTNLSKDEEERFIYLKESFLKNNYILENKSDVNNYTSLQAVLQNFPSEFGLFILIFAVMISGSIIAEEFSKGTIKYLLTKPYKRSTVLTSKLFTVLLLIPLVVMFMVAIEVLVGGIILGFSSLKIPVLIFDNVTNSLINFNIFEYLFKMLVSHLPMYIILGILCFTLSTITVSTSAAITITFLFYLVSNIISNMALIYNIKLFKAFISLHWDFSYLVNLVTNPYNIKPIYSILIILIYIFVMLCIAYVYFNKKDVKNV